MLTIKNTALIVVDIQEKLMPVMFQKEKLVDNVKKLIKGVQVLDIPVIVTEQYPQGLGPTIQEISNLLTGIQPLEKTSFSCFVNKRFAEILEQLKRRQILIAGIESHVCIYQTARDLVNSGFEVFLITDAVSSRTQENREVGFNLMRQAGVTLTSVETVLFDLLQVAGGEKFKAISHILK